MSGGVLMRLQRVGLTAATFILFLVTSSAEAAILAADDFSGPGSGTGWEAGNDWEGLGGGVASTAGGVASFRDFAAPIDGTNTVTYVRFDFTETVPGTGAQWGGASFFEGMEGTPGDETLFMGHAGQPASPPPTIGLDQLPGQLLSNVVIGSQPHTIITEIDTTPAGDAVNFRLWVDSFDINAPSATITKTNSPANINAPWNTFRLQANAPVTQLYDNLTIATTAREVGLVVVPEPASLGLFGLFVLMALGINGRRR
jgi:PEP-CTERM motif